ncbi:MAG: c-type cytochrome [Myxococcaceae bacterium]|nr:c-type cytochrome [Myxococcaceae bacterium]
MKTFLLALLIAPGLALAADPPKKDAKKDAKAAVAAPDPAVVAEGAKLFQDRTCWSCHGKDAKTPIMPAYPKLAGQNAEYAERQMLDIKSGARANANAAAMKGVMGLVNDAEIKTISIYLSTLQ